jgi:hypothetical protein
MDTIAAMGLARLAAGILAGTVAATTAWAIRAPVVVPPAGAELLSASRQCYVKVLEGARPDVRRVRLYGPRRLALEVSGAREMAWIGETLVFSVSPASGQPGIYAWDCAASSVVRVVGPERANLAHPGGTDLYRLVEIDGDILYYAHAPDVDSPTLERDLQRGIETLRLSAAHPRISMR